MSLTCDDVRDLAAAYVLGALDAPEAAAIRAHLAECPEAHEEVHALGGVVPYLADTLAPVDPPAGLRVRLLAAAAADRPGLAERRDAVPGGAAEGATEGVAAPIPFPTLTQRERSVAGRPSARATWALRIAAVLAIAVLGAWNLQLQSNLSGVQADLTAARAYQQGVAAVLDVGTRAGARTAFLAAAKAGLTSSGVAAAAPDGTVVMAIHGLTPTTGNQVYEAWVIVGKDAPVPLGGFTVSGGGTGVLRASTSLARTGAVLALTLEPVPGATAPTGPVLSAGSLVAPAG